MALEDGTWVMRGLDWKDPHRIKTWQELIDRIKEVGFLPLFANEVAGFSAEECVSPLFWWTGDPAEDPWEWRELIAASREVAYGKFFGGRAGFISLDWLPAFANVRRDGYDFDARWEDGLANRREKRIMDILTDRDSDGEMVFPDRQIISTELKKIAGFGKGKEKNFPGITTGLQMQTYLVITGFRRRVNKRGEEYGMAVSIMQPPEAVWGYELVTRDYGEKPAESWEKIAGRLREVCPGCREDEIVRVVGRRPE